MPAAHTNRDLLTPQQAADRIGWKPDSIRKAARQGRIDCVKIGGRVFIPTRAVSDPARFAQPDGSSLTPAPPPGAPAEG